MKALLILTLSLVVNAYTDTTVVKASQMNSRGFINTIDAAGFIDNDGFVCLKLSPSLLKDSSITVIAKIGKRIIRASNRMFLRTKRYGKYYLAVEFPSLAEEYCKRTREEYTLPFKKPGLKKFLRKTIWLIIN